MQLSAAVFLFGLATVTATDYAISWTDCGGRAKVTSLTPDTITSGTTTTITGSGTLDEDVPSATYEMTIKAGPLSILDHKGDACSGEEISLPLGLGKMSWKGTACPMKTGTVSISLDATLSSVIPPAVANGVKIDITATSASNEKLVCMEVTLSKKSSDVEVEGASGVAAGACNADDQSKIEAMGGGDDDGHFPKTTSDCGKSALNILKGIDETKFNQCLTTKVGFSSGCSDCYWKAAQYGYANCKLACISSWCSKTCLDCAAGFDTNSCAGFTPKAQPTVCNGEDVVV